ncbi:MAG: S41 family peptidase [Janthinobacterium lividum]
MLALDRRHLLKAVSGLAATAFLPSHALASSALVQPEAMRRDIAILCDAYSSLHPGLYRYLTPASFLDERHRLDRFAGTSRSLGEFYLALSAFTASIRCGHSFPNPANQPAAVTAALFDKPDRLPFAFEWIDSRMIVSGDLGSGHGLAPGCEVLAVDDVGADDILHRMLPYARTDGGNDVRKIADLGIPGDAEQPSFDLLRSLLFPSAASSARLLLRANGRSSTIICRLMTAAARDAALLHPIPGSPYGWRFEVRGSIGVLTMPTWAVFHEPWDWHGFIDASIDAAIDRKLTGIVIDVRDNPGGLDCGAALLARLIAAPLATTAYSRHVRYRAIPERLSPYLKTWDRSFRDWGASALGPDSAGFYTLTSSGDASDPAVINPTGRRFAGKVAVLVGPKNASATFGFAALVKQHRVATLVGEVTGGNLRGINGGAFFFVGLPESGIEIDLPLIAYWPDTPQPDAGLTPDIVVTPGPDDVAAGHDRQMQRAVAIAST